VHPSLKVKFNKDFKKVNNSEFVEGTALIAYSGDNRNGSDITDNAFNDAMPSLGLIPLVGHWLPDKQNFGGHDITIEWSGNVLVLKDNTVPYGVVKENHNAERIEIEENGQKHQYIKADVVLWYGRYPEPVQKVIDTGVNQSMEINVKSYSEKDTGNVQIDSFEYSALCLLGLDVDENGNTGSNNVEPCFESASIIVDKFTANNKFKEQLSQLVFALKDDVKTDKNFSIQNQSSNEVDIKNNVEQLGGNKVDEKDKLLEKYNLTSESLKFSIDDLSVEELENKIKEHFALLASQKQEELANALRVEKYRDRWGDECSKYSYVEHSDTEVFAYDRQDNWNLYGFTYSMSGDKVIIDFATKKRKKFEIVDFVEGEIVFSLFPQEAIEYVVADKVKENETKVSEEFEALKTKSVEFEATITNLNTEIATLKTTNEDLLIYKNKNEKELHETAIGEVFTEFDESLKENQEYIELKEKVNADVMNYNVENLEKELFVMIGKVNFSKTNKKTKVEKVSASVIEGTGTEVVGSRYGKYEKFIEKKD